MLYAESLIERTVRRETYGGRRQNAIDVATSVQ